MSTDKPLTDDWIALEHQQGPRQPLDEMRRDIAEARAEIARLRSMLAYLARCLSVSDFCTADRDYAASLAAYIDKRIPATELTDTYISEQTMERLYDAVETELEKEENK